MRRFLLLATGLAAMAVQAERIAPYRQIHRIFAIEPEKIEAARERSPAAFSNGVIIATFVGLKIGPAEAKDFERQKAFVARMKARGLPVQICLSSTIGHFDDWQVVQPWPKMVGANGKVAEAVCCPRSEGFRAYVGGLFAKYAALGPDVIWFDDDFRMAFHPPADNGCFCPDCLKAFRDETGIEIDMKGPQPRLRTAAIRAKWFDFGRRTMNELVRIGADAAHKVDPNVALGFMVANLDVQAYCPPDLKEWIRLGRNAKGEVWLRPGSGFYDDFSPYGALQKNIAIGRLVAATEGEGVVNVTEEVTSPYTRRGKSMRITFLEAALNVGLAGADGTTYDAIKPNLDEQLKDNAVVAEMARKYPLLDAMYGLVRGKRQIGVAVPPHNDSLWKAFCLGIPFTFRPQHAVAETPADFLCGDPLAFARGEEIKAELEKRCGGKLPARIDSALRVGLSLWESSDRRERTVFVWNFDFDEARDVRLVLDGEFAAEVLPDDGPWKPLGTGDSFALAPLAPWSVRVLRLTKTRHD